MTLIPNPGEPGVFTNNATGERITLQQWADDGVPKAPWWARVWRQIVVWWYGAAEKAGWIGMAANGDVPPVREREATPEEVAAPAETKPSGAVTVSVAPTPEPAVPDPVPAPEAKAEVPQSTRDKRPAKVADAAPKPVPAPVVQDPVVPPPEPVLPRGTVRLGGGATSLSLVASDGTVHPAGRVDSGRQGETQGKNIQIGAKFT